MLLLRSLPMLLTISVILSSISNVKGIGSYTCSLQVKPITPVLQKRHKQTKRALSTSFPKNEFCDQKYLLLPFRLDKLTFPYVEVLPNQEVCILGMKMPNVCIPTNPVPFTVSVNGREWSLLISDIPASYLWRIGAGVFI